MNILPIDKKVLDKFGPYTLITGILLIVLGTAGIILPGVMSLGTALFVAWLFLIGGILWAIHTYKYLSLIHISEPTRLGMISYAVFCLKKKKKNNSQNT